MVIYIKYGELVLKGKNKKDFINCLYRNVRKALQKYPKCMIVKQFDNMVINHVLASQVNAIINILRYIPGILYIIKAYPTKSTYAAIKTAVLKKLPEQKCTFKVETKRNDKRFPINSMDFSKKLGGDILAAFKQYKVIMEQPDLLIKVEIKPKVSYFYFDRIPGIGGFPIGINGKVLMLISGGIDSPVAAALLLKKGYQVDFLTFITPPHTSPKALDKVRRLVKIVNRNDQLCKSKLFIVNFTNLQHELAHLAIPAYQITIMRRYFFRIARDLAQKDHYQAIATGESLGQVASQTIQSMQTIQQAVNDFLILRPLLTYDKSEIINLAKKYGTYDVSIEPYADCCALFVPQNPATKPTIHTALELEKSLGLADAIYQKILTTYLTIED
ncbi:MAG: tRNA 4-thiouridine(8) synthase ThiI [Mycoplasmataceae bacterium]|jgi:thiamine biosynthesis protein ThiI|nr:tRNA 4-thiouridine(8) synthase ThiI [Mycoplasmataceae bacterium]